mgnify:CR=1 FL=1
MNLSLSEATVMLWGGGPLCWEMVSSVCEGAFTRSADFLSLSLVYLLGVY